VEGSDPLSRSDSRGLTPGAEASGLGHELGTVIQVEAFRRRARRRCLEACLKEAVVRFPVADPGGQYEIIEVPQRAGKHTTELLIVKSIRGARQRQSDLQSLQSRMHRAMSSLGG